MAAQPVNVVNVDTCDPKAGQPIHRATNRITPLPFESRYLLVKTLRQYHSGHDLVSVQLVGPVLNCFVDSTGKWMMLMTLWTINRVPYTTF